MVPTHFSVNVRSRILFVRHEVSMSAIDLNKICEDDKCGNLMTKFPNYRLDRIKLSNFVYAFFYPYVVMRCLDAEIHVFRSPKRVFECGSGMYQYRFSDCLELARRGICPPNSTKHRTWQFSRKPIPSGNRFCHLPGVQLLIFFIRVEKLSRLSSKQQTPRVDA